ncbi:hypothetical protein, partial [Veillonella agrestimuris]|uniref:hypothetical protein n=1 Tax=Veillonella agrestimuris TaxID=2941340 RepID=UPI0020426B4B
NTVVKLINAESTWLETAWEDRKSLIKLKGTPEGVPFFVMNTSASGSSERSICQAAKQHRQIYSEE